MVKQKPSLFFYSTVLDKIVYLWYVTNSMIHLNYKDNSTVVSINGVPEPCENSKSDFDANRENEISKMANGANQTAVLIIR